MTPSDIRSLCLVPMILLGGMTGLLVVRRRQWLDPEWLRKLVHIGMGCAVMAFPWIFDSVAAVWTLAGMCIVAFLYMRTPWSFLGPILHEVNRTSIGEIAWVIAVGLTFQFRQGTGDFLAAVAILTFSDPAAALVGKRWGRHRFKTIFGHDKSLEGSITCLAVTVLILFAGCSLGLWTLSPLAVLSAALAVTVAEALIGFGLDNLAIPLIVLLFFR